MKYERSHPDDAFYHVHDPEIVTLGIHRRHVFVATLSGVLSALAHIGLLVYLLFAQINIPTFQSAHQPPREQHEAMRLRSIDRETFVDAVQPFGTPPAGMFAGAGIAESIDVLSASAPPSFDVSDAAFEGSISKPTVAPAEGQWQPRQEILSIDSAIAIQALPGLERRALPDMIRVPEASDIVFPVASSEMFSEAGKAATAAHLQGFVNAQGTNHGGRQAGQPQTPGTADLGSRVTGERAAPPPSERVEISEAASEAPAEVFEEAPAEVTTIKPIEKMLTADLDVYFDNRDTEYGYFRIAINRIDQDVLPVVPKDILLVQDASASISEQRLYFCREVLSEIIDRIGPDDRFNVVRFNDKAEFCFEDWAPRSADAFVKARSFIAAMQSTGETDLLASLKPLLDVSTTPGRPVIALLITDGLATTGLTRSTDIIGEFSKLNEGRISVFSMGTMMTANTYLLDLLSYCNRGDSRLVVGGRWGIPEVLVSLMRELSHPVLADVSLRFAKGAMCEVYPWSTMNLYSDRALYIYGRFPRDLESFTFQAKGAAGNAECDMIFTMNISEGRLLPDKSIRENWAQQKIYTLSGAYARTQDPRYLRALDQTSHDYKIKVPYRKKL